MKSKFSDCSFGLFGAMIKEKSKKYGLVLGRSM